MKPNLLGLMPETTKVGYVEVEEYRGGGHGFVVEIDENDMSVYMNINTKEPDIEKLPVPLHGGCLEVVRQFCEYRGRTEANCINRESYADSLLAQLYEIWKHRIIMSDVTLQRTGTGGFFADVIKEPNNYFGAPLYKCDLQKYIKEELDEDLTDHSEKFLSAPHQFRDVTRFIAIDNLRRIPGRQKRLRPTSASLAAKLERLPREIKNMCLDYVRPFVDEDLLCNRILPPAWWRDMLFRGQIIPWLWDRKFAFLPYLASHSPSRALPSQSQLLLSL